jgi:CDP-3, 6-dideoxy-D-glycero-L-glycero-4-hexulose-4-reductase
MKILITGATSFIGQHVVNAFKNNGDEVFVLLRKKLHSNFLEYPSNIEAYFLSDQPSSEEVLVAIQSISPECIVHIAGKTFDDSDVAGREKTVEANFLFGWHLLNTALECKIPYFLNTGTYWSFGDIADNKPNTLYALMKSNFQKTLEFYASRHFIKSLTLVLYDVYGPNDPRKKILWQLLRAIKDGSSLEVTQGKQKLDFVHIDDVAKGFLLGSRYLISDQSPSFSQYALRTGTLYDLRMVSENMGKILGKTPNIVWGAKPYPRHQIFHANDSIPVLPGWFPKLLEDRLSDLIREDVL